MTLKNCYCRAGKKSQADIGFVHDPLLDPCKLIKHDVKLNSKSIIFYILSSLSLLLVGLYRSVFTAHFGAGVCRFEPTCSAYANQAFLKYPFITALKLVLQRVLKCYPGSSFGYDPLPDLNAELNFSAEITHECR